LSLRIASRQNNSIKDICIGGGQTTVYISGDTILGGYNSLGATRFDIGKSVVGVGPYYDYVLDITFSDGLNATFTGTYDADGFDNSNTLVAVSEQLPL
tara:strand:+ start:100 stop:393 length:294 start_codon:yes stop_codon:yes gene_type:complete